MQRSLCVWFLQVLFAWLALMKVLAVASQQNYLLGSYTAVAERIPPGTRCSQKSPCEGRHHGQEDMVAGLSGKLSRRGRRSSDDHSATRRHQLQQTNISAEVQALMALKEGITNDPLGALTDWNPNEADPCHWEGVTCGQRSNSIVALDLGGFRLKGTISPLLGRLTNLQNLDLSDNFFQGEIPNTLLNCTHLSYLVLRNNNLTGEIPSQVGDLQHLQYVDLGSNLLLAGRIPASLSNCSLLRFLHLNYTVLSGEIPSNVGLLSRLESLNLTYTFISGTIPKSLGNCSYLTGLTLGNPYDLDYASTNIATNPEHELGGELPAELAQLKRLKALGIGGTNIGGTFPAWIANLTELTELGLAFSPFTGEIPEFLGSLPLEYLILEGSTFSGAIPASIGNCSNMWILRLGSSPNMSGAIPPELGMLSKLGTLMLDEMGLTGRIPPSLSNCSALRVLTLEGNPLFDPQPVPSWIASLVNLSLLGLADMNLQGEIPGALGELSRLDTLSFWSNQLTGPIPATLGNCTSLVFLELSINQLSGELPPEIWMLNQLQTFYFHTNSLTGTLPAFIGNLSFLQTFACDDNSFSGEIPSQVGSLQTLESAYFETNLFDGTIPESLGNWSFLALLDMSGNKLSGSIPDSLGNLTKLVYLDLSRNLLGGGIPGELTRCTALTYLNLSQNQLVGIIPQEIGQLASLRGLYLNDNQLSGELPESLGLLTGLLFLDLSHNALDGAVPGEIIANISSNMNSLNVSHNRLSNSLPTELGKLTVVYYLDFSFNNLSGSIPLSLGDCKSLLQLDLSVNNLSGDIPSALAQLQTLTFVNVSYNQLQGPIPQGGVFNSSNITAASFLGNPGLCGSRLKSCPVGSSPESAPSCKDFSCGSVRTAIILACAGAGIVLVAGVVLIYWLIYHHGKTDAAQSAVVTFDTGLIVSQEELLAIIERSENIIGVGAMSTIYKGVLNAGRTIAIKVLSLPNDSDDYEYNQQAAATHLYTEAHTLGELRHRNILKVFGLFSTDSIKALILEFMPNASLHQQLYNVEECALNWEARLNIALGVAQGMVYLHSQAHVPVIHRDLKPGNIFLDADLEPKLGDFGISRFVHPDRLGDAGEITASKFCGTFGYIPPEYAATTRVSTKGDVYSYGVILLELLTRKRPIVDVPYVQSEENDFGQHGERSRHLVDWVLESSKEAPLAVLDPMLLLTSDGIPTNCDGDDNNSGEQMKLLMQVGLLCTQNDPQSRPQMSDVLAMLVQIKERGLDPAHRPTVAELANDITPPGLNNAQDFGSN